MAGGPVEVGGEESVDAVAAAAGVRERFGELLHAVVGGGLDGEAAVAVHEVFGEVAARAEDHERFVGGGEERADRCKELHVVAFLHPDRTAVRCLFGCRQPSLLDCRSCTGNVSANDSRINGHPALSPAVFIGGRACWCC
jgi:hypothetical protein